MPEICFFFMQVALFSGFHLVIDVKSSVESLAPKKGLQHKQLCKIVEMWANIRPMICTKLDSLEFTYKA